MIFSLRKRIHQLAGELLRAHVAPHKVAAAVLIGCIVGCTPLFGLHIFVCIALAWLLRLNQVIVYGAANLSVPPMIPLLGFVSVQLGEKILHGRWLPLTRASFAGQGAHQIAKTFFVDWMVGGVVLGAAVGAVAGAIAWRVLYARRPRTEIEQLILTARSRYDGLHPRFKWYARMKYVMDPCYRAIAPLVPQGAFAVDLGTGLGMLPVLLGMMGRRALGVEWDKQKVACGLHAAKGLDVEIVEGDVREYAIPACDVVILVDMLHYYDADTQRVLLRRCREALREGGRVLVREGDRERAGGAGWTRFVERWMVRVGWNRGPAVHFRPLADLRADLESLGFAVRVDEVAGTLHPGNVLLVGVRSTPKSDAISDI